MRLCRALAHEAAVLFRADVLVWVADVIWEKKKKKEALKTNFPTFASFHSADGGLKEIYGEQDDLFQEGGKKSTGTGVGEVRGKDERWVVRRKRGRGWAQYMLFLCV